MQTRIKSYLEKSKNEFHRYNSWNHCYNAFGNHNLLDEQLALHLAFYLASWGMYRGSSKLLQKDHLVHLGAVKIIQEFKHLRSDSNKEIKAEGIESLLILIKRLKEYYLSHSVTPTMTLISKIILGALASLPAFDRYFIAGVKVEDHSFKCLNKKSIEELFLFLEQNEEGLREIQEEELAKSDVFYPKMKLIDMYFWERGFKYQNDMD